MGRERARFVCEQCGAELLTVVEKRAGIPLGSAEALLHVPGGIRVTEPAADVGAAPAAEGTHREAPMAGKTGCADELCW